jgi:hypothetical protein
MAGKASLSERWNHLEPSKKFVFWACVVCIALTIFVGFKWGGWVTGGTAREMAENAAAEARIEIAVASCMERFAGAADRGDRLAKLKATDSWMRGTYVEKAGWVTLAGMEKPVEDAGGRCAEAILAAAAARAEAAN